tara:strand:- start:106 stop:348 length:243 start_codon:yes stop_codon:yes gene_type:complete
MTQVLQGILALARVANKNGFTPQFVPPQGKAGGDGKYRIYFYTYFCYLFLSLEYILFLSLLSCTEKYPYVRLRNASCCLV